LSRKEMLDELLFMILSGFETAATFLSWFTYLMSKHPEVQKKIKQELKQHGISQDTMLTPDMLDQLVYVDCVIKEVFRFSPNVNATLRTLVADDYLGKGDKIYHLHRGEVVLISFYNLHFDRRYWIIDPERFYPDRFLSEDKNHHPYALIPFGGGHRACIGQDLAKLELKIIITRLMQFITFEDGGEDINSGGHKQGLTVTPKNLAVYVQFDS
ncbi:unnamed protein product, partial [Didymodactylos carnosus]